MNNQSGDRDELLCDVFTQGAGQGFRSSDLPLLAARLVRARRRRRRAWRVAGALVVAVALVWSSLPRRSAAEKPAVWAGTRSVPARSAVSYAVVHSAAPVYSVISDEEFADALAGRAVLMIPEPRGGVRVVFLK